MIFSSASEISQSLLNIWNFRIQLTTNVGELRVIVAKNIRKDIHSLSSQLFWMVKINNFIDKVIEALNLKFEQYQHVLIILIIKKQTKWIKTLRKLIRVLTYQEINRTYTKSRI